MRASANVISHRIQVLEAYLGCRLFNRTTRRISLTEQGRSYYEHVVEALHVIESAEANIGALGAMPRGAIKVASPLGLGRRLIAPLAARFQDAHPQVDLQLRLTERRLDIVAESIDLAVQFAELQDSSMIMRKVADAQRVLCASPDYLQRAGAPQTLANLLEHQCLLLRFPGAPEFRWTLMKDGAPVTLPVKGHLDADDGDVLTVWALAGRGIALKPIFEIAEHLAAGRLIRILGSHPPPPATLAVLYPARQLMPLKVKAFADLVVEEGRRYLACETAKFSESEPLSGESSAQ